MPRRSNRELAIAKRHLAAVVRRGRRERCKQVIQDVRSPALTFGIVLAVHRREHALQQRPEVRRQERGRPVRVERRDINDLLAFGGANEPL
jgi:hypothetical protein